MNYRKVEDHVLVSEFVLDYEQYTIKRIAGKSTKMLEKRIAKEQAELLARGLLTQEEIDFINS